MSDDSSPTQVARFEFAQKYWAAEFRRACLDRDISAGPAVGVAPFTVEVDATGDDLDTARAWAKTWRGRAVDGDGRSPERDSVTGHDRAPDGWSSSSARAAGEVPGPLPVRPVVADPSDHDSQVSEGQTCTREPRGGSHGSPDDPRHTSPRSA